MQNKAIRFKFVLSVLVITAAMMVGYNVGQLRPAFTELMEITKVDLEKGSSIMTSYLCGRLVGSGLGGILYPKMNTYLIFAMFMAIESGIVAAIPWCSVFELMVAVHVLHGILLGVINIAVTTTSMQLWGPTSRGRTYVQILYVFIEISFALAPIGTAPFLKEKENIDYFSNVTEISTRPLHTGTCCSGHDSYINGTVTPDSEKPVVLESTLYVAYSISAGMAIVVSILFTILYVTTSVNDSTEKRKITARNSLGSLPPIANYLQFINIGLYAGVYSVIDVCFPQYLTVFCVQHLNLTQNAGAMMTSVFALSRLGGRLAGIFLVRAMKPHTILLFSSVLDTLGFVCLTLSAYMFVNVGIWISACITGLATSIMWPTTLNWINSYLTPVDGKVSSYLLGLSFLCALCTPILLGYLMQEVSLLWFCYSCLIASVINVINVVFMVIHTIYFERKRHSYTVKVYTVDQPDQMECQTEVSRL